MGMFLPHFIIESNIRFYHLNCDINIIILCASSLEIVCIICSVVCANIITNWFCIVDRRYKNSWQYQPVLVCYSPMNNNICNNVPFSITSPYTYTYIPHYPRNLLVITYIAQLPYMLHWLFAVYISNWANSRINEMFKLTTYDDLIISTGIQSTAWSSL